jgi:hypothetical protein
MQDHRARSPQPKAAQVTALIGQIGKLIDQDPCDQCHEVKPTLQYDIDSDHVFCSMECRNTWRKVHDVG